MEKIWGKRGVFQDPNTKGKIRESRIALGKYRREIINNEVLKKYDENTLKRVRINELTRGFIFSDCGKAVAIINTERKSDGVWIQGLEVFSRGQGKGLSWGLLDIAVSDLGAEFLSVRKTNKIAIHIYETYGFNRYSETETMIFMKLKR